MSKQRLSKIERDAIHHQYTVHGVAIEALAELFEQTEDVIRKVLRGRGATVPDRRHNRDWARTFDLEEVDQLMAQGMTQYQAAQKLGVSSPSISQRRLVLRQRQIREQQQANQQGIEG